MNALLPIRILLLLSALTHGLGASQPGTKQPGASQPNASQPGAKQTTATQALAKDIFGKLGVRVVRCPAYTADGGNIPVCGVSIMAPEAYIQAFDKAASGKLEPQDAWDEDHTVWLRRFTAGGLNYAAVYSEIARGFNVEFIGLK